MCYNNVKKGGGYMTLSKLAQLANVSVSVVSKAFAGKEGVSRAMREHVFAVAKEHGCFEQFYHVPYDKPVIAVIIPEAISVYYIHFIEVLKKSMEQNGYTMLLSISNFDPEMTEELLRYYTEHSRVNGMVIFEDLPKLHGKTDTIIISVTERSDSGSENGIHLDLTQGLTAAVRHLKNLGHSRIAYVGEPLTQNKCDDLRRVTESEGLALPDELLVCSLHRFEDAGRDGLRRLMSLNDRPTAVFGAYGYITSGIISEAESMGLCIPDDLSVISMDSDPSPIHRILDVSRIPSGIDKICEAIMSALNHKLNPTVHKEADSLIIPSEFYTGDTVGRVK